MSTTTSASIGLQAQLAGLEAAEHPSATETCPNEPAAAVGTEATPQPTPAHSESHGPPTPLDAGAVKPVAEMRLDSAVPTPHGSVGQRLRAAREAKGWGIEDVGGRLHIPVQIIRALEAEQFDKIGYGVYLRGYLTSYARLVDVPTVLVENIVRERNHAPPLVASGTISRSRYLYQRYSVSALYLVLTGVIIVPAVMLAMRASMQPSVTQLTPLDAPPVSAPADAQSASAVKDGGAVASSVASSENGAPAPAEAPLVASIAPFSALSHKDVAHADAPAPSAQPPGTHTLKLTLREASWVEVVSASGEKLEYGLLPAGTSRSYASDKSLDVRLGNSSGAEVETDGQVQDLAPYRRSNVAHFRLFASGQAISRTDQ